MITTFTKQVSGNRGTALSTKAGSMATRTSYSKLFEPIKIGGVEIRNRVAMGAMGNFFLTNVDGSFNQRCVGEVALA